jgi:hypothetical protein
LGIFKGGVGAVLSSKCVAYAVMSSALKKGANLEIRSELHMVGVRPQSAEDLKRTSKMMMKLMNSFTRKSFWPNADDDKIANLKFNIPPMWVYCSLVRMRTQREFAPDFGMTCGI